MKRNVSARTFRAIDKSGMLSSSRMAIFATLCQNGTLTASEISSFLDVPRDSVSPRLAELARMGIVEKAGKKSCEATGTVATTWTALNAMPKKLSKTVRRKWFLVQNKRSVDPVAFTNKTHAEAYARRVKSTVIEAVERSR